MYVIVLTIYFVGMYLIGLFKRNNGYVDIGWGFGFVLIAFVQMVLKSFQIEAVVLFMIVAIWGLRLTVHLYLRNAHSIEDYRYKNMRDKWGKYTWIRALVQIYFLQGILMYFIAAPIIHLEGSFKPYALLAFLISIIGLTFEIVGDYQLKQHINKHPGVLMTSGLWSLTRHPNYFGDALVWTGIGLYSILVGSSVGVLIGPLIMIVLLRYVSGVPLLEKKMSKKDGWIEYARRVPPFVPRWNRKG